MLRVNDWLLLGCDVQKSDCKEWTSEQDQTLKERLDDTGIEGVTGIQLEDFEKRLNMDVGNLSLQILQGFMTTDCGPY